MKFVVTLQTRYDKIYTEWDAEMIELIEWSRTKTVLIDWQNEK